MKYNGLVILLILFISISVSAQDQTNYIRQFQDLAIAEMLRTGIPASIKLAQAIHESNCGKSELAARANNHFGIKCGGDWRGKSFHKEDDDYQNGKLIKSCFRHFNSVMESYIAHSDFLTDPAKSGRYGSLFQLQPTDYKSWARGLSRAGYATDPQYANRLIDIIEKHELYRFDNEYESVTVSKSPPSSSGVTIVRYQNDVRYATAIVGDNVMILASRHDVQPAQLVRYNDDISSKDQNLIAGTKVYLQPKRGKYQGTQQHHLVKVGDDMVSISQQYGIKLEALLKRNGLQRHDVPMPRQKIALKGKNKSTPKTINPYEVPTTLPARENTNPAAPSDVVYVTHTPKTEPNQNGGPNVATVEVVRMPAGDAAHIVTKGETLYRIAREYGLTVDELKKRNNLSADTIRIGQKLSVK